MKKFFLLLIFLTTLIAKEWELKNISFVTENDGDFREDRDYTYGSELNILYKVSSNKFYSFSLAQQMFTPNNFDKDDINFSKERPYAGYMYIGARTHTIKENQLTSYTISVGLVGPSTKMDQVQKIIHSLIGSPKPKGWDKQIKDEFILQWNVEKRFLYYKDDFYGFSQNYIPYIGANIGNVSTKGVAGIMYRISDKKLYDFGSSRINYRGYNHLSLHDQLKNNYWFGLWIEGNIIARDIFLDGNSFKKSVSVDKNIFVAKGGFLIGFRYKKFLFEWLRTFSTKEFTTQDYYHSYGSFLFSYDF